MHVVTTWSLDEKSSLCELSNTVIIFISIEKNESGSCLELQGIMVGRCVAKGRKE
jgi:hypothetical protein